ncbi:ribosomal protein S18 acetylase RimI-like enzyme [Rhizobium sp. BK650]|uniref:GNAT family N-acetyltransferase n=1 Tax=Rhizobium sp. BK650 TaxID=2586990 RepID=UPI00161F3388|nr:GNAT family N-acetyltransferase [Rhizobium sp. BK650]MBB3656025.1 ribosomal protein S18 acetylase RimI-like enzyme [Rhizobium sp. BK650]
MTWNIRPNRPEDAMQLADIYLSVRRKTFTWVDPGKFHREDFAAHTNGEVVSVCEAPNGKIAGFISIWAADDFIHMLYILPELQGRGAGTALLQSLPGWPQHTYRLKCLVNNRHAKAFYLAHGFQVTGRGASTEGDYEELSLAPASAE